MSNIWNDVTNEYELKQRVGLGSYGEVVAATHISSGKLVAIKLINNVNKNEYETKKVLREIQILRKFTQMKNNHYAVKLYDIIIPNTSKLTHLFLVLEHMPTDLKKVIQAVPKVKFKF